MSPAWCTVLVCRPFLGLIMKKRSSTTYATARHVYHHFYPPSCLPTVAFPSALPTIFFFLFFSRGDSGGGSTERTFVAFGGYRHELGAGGGRGEESSPPTPSRPPPTGRYLVDTKVEWRGREMALEANQGIVSICIVHTHCKNLLLYKIGYVSSAFLFF